MEQVTVPSVLVDAPEQAVLAIEHGRVIGLNEACARLLKVDAVRAIGRDAIEVLRNHRLEMVALLGGEISLELAGRTVRARSIPGGLILEDITDQVRQEQELREVLATLSHEFRTPVTALKSLLEAISHNPPPEKRSRFLELAQSEIDRLARLVEDLTTGFRPTQMRTFAFSEAFERTAALLSNELATRNVQLRLKGGEHLVRADPDKLVQVLLNLIENAGRYGPNPGDVHVVVTPPLTQSGPTVSVIDEGQELPDYASLFLPHRRGANASSPGTGMGLYIVRLIVEAWGGQVWARHLVPQSAENINRGGNEFAFSLPNRE